MIFPAARNGALYSCNFLLHVQ